MTSKQREYPLARNTGTGDETDGVAVVRHVSVVDGSNNQGEACTRIAADPDKFTFRDFFAGAGLVRLELDSP